MLKKELVDICTTYLQEPKYKVNKMRKGMLEYLYYEVILLEAFESNATLVDNN